MPKPSKKQFQDEEDDLADIDLGFTDNDESSDFEEDILENEDDAPLE